MSEYILHDTICIDTYTCCKRSTSLVVDGAPAYSVIFVYDNRDRIIYFA